MGTEIADHVTEGSFVIASQVRYFREIRGMSQEDLAKATGMKQSTISRLESTPDVQWRSTAIVKIAHALDMAVICRFAGPEQIGT